MDDLEGMDPDVARGFRAGLMAAASVSLPQDEIEKMKDELIDLRSDIDAFWEAVANQWHIEPREYFEAEIAKGIGFSDSPLAMAVHHMTKRDRRLPEGVQRVVDAADHAVTVYLMGIDDLDDELMKLHASLTALKSSEDEAVDALIAAEGEKP